MSNQMGIASLYIVKTTAAAYGCIRHGDTAIYNEQPHAKRATLTIWLPKSQLSQIEIEFDEETARNEITFRAPIWLLEEKGVLYQDD